jgi:hypothetical protein
MLKGDPSQFPPPARTIWQPYLFLKPSGRVALKSAQRGKARTILKMSQLLTQYAFFDRSRDSGYKPEHMRAVAGKRKLALRKRALCFGVDDVYPACSCYKHTLT